MCCVLLLLFSLVTENTFVVYAAHFIKEGASSEKADEAQIRLKSTFWPTLAKTQKKQRLPNMGMGLACVYQKDAFWIWSRAMDKPLALLSFVLVER